MTESEIIVITDPDSDRYHTFGYISWWQQEVVRNATVLVIGAGALGYRRSTHDVKPAAEPRAREPILQPLHVAVEHRLG